METSGARRWRAAMQALVVLGAAALAGSGDQSLPSTVTKAPKVTRVVIVKSERTMALLSKGQVIKTYKVALGTEPVGRKERQGDHKTPEGLYVIDSKNAKSQFHLSLHISYPNAEDRARARRMGVSPGGAIMIHGLPREFAWMGALHRQTDWTDGCVAVTNEEIEEIWELVRVGTPVEIQP
jgi:murein L,D-transpeptidase YafK